MIGPRSSRSALPSTALALTATVVILGACGADDSTPAGSEPIPAPAASEFPKANGTIEDLLSEVGTTDQIVAPPSGATFAPGDDRFGFALFEVSGEQILDADVAIYAAQGASGKALGPFPAQFEDLTTEPEFVAQTTTPDDAKGVYVSEVPFDETGEWRLAAVVNRPEGQVATPIATSILVEDQIQIPAVGEQAPAIHTPTAAEVGADIESIDTRVPASSMHEDDLADVLGKEPAVLLFATPALCQSRVCGPVVDVAEQVKATYGDDAAFIHMEIYQGNELDPNKLRSQVTDYGLQSEPWLFVIDADGQITTRIEGAFSVSELEEALKPLAG